MGVSYTEYYGYPREEGNYFTGGKRTRRLICAWADRYNLVNELLETYYPYGGGSVAHEYAIDPFPNSSSAAGSGSIAAYDHALVTIVYDDKVYLFNGNAITEEVVTYDNNNRIIGRGVFWKTGSNRFAVQNGEAPDHSESGLTYILTYHRLYLNQVNPAWLAYTGYVNGGIMTTKRLGLWFNTDMVKYRGMRLQYNETLGVATPTVSCALRFDYVYRNGWGWQGAFRQETGQYEALYDVNGNQKLQYPRGSFAF